ncbi:MAG TPA: TetR/AcrR family transcriptional regulator [Thermoanaerobaculia bacterium]|nr:TetR/AcrR family transcriptional regulator [Thermoanaerobaculia bacterium]
MSPRAYRLGRREADTEKTRARIVAAARRLLLSPRGFAESSIDAVAREAGVARMTVYHRFGSKRGLLQGIFDDLAARGGMSELRDVFRNPDPLAALSEFISVFTGFWTSGRVVIRRLHGQGVIDPALGEALREREERRREGLRVIVKRISEKEGRPRAAAFDDAVDTLFTLTSFETFDSLARGKRRPPDVTALVHRLALAAIRGEPPRGGNKPS